METFVWMCNICADLSHDEKDNNKKCNKKGCPGTYRSCPII